MWANNSTVNCKMRVPGMTATTPAMVIIDSATQTVSQSAIRSQITAARIEEARKSSRTQYE